MISSVELKRKICIKLPGNKQKNNPIKKQAKDLNGYFPEKIYKWPISM